VTVFKRHIFLLATGCIGTLCPLAGAGDAASIKRDEIMHFEKYCSENPEEKKELLKVEADDYSYSNLIKRAQQLLDSSYVLACSEKGYRERKEAISQMNNLVAILDVLGRFALRGERRATVSVLGGLLLQHSPSHFNQYHPVAGVLSRIAKNYIYDDEPSHNPPSEASSCALDMLTYAAREGGMHCAWATHYLSIVRTSAL